MAETRFVLEWDEYQLTSAAAVAVGELWQVGDGRAAVFTGGKDGKTAGDSGKRADFELAGKFTLPLTSSITILDGGRIYWDHSANLAHYKKVNDRDFYCGRAVGDSATTSVVCDLNADPPYDIDLFRDAALTVLTGTQAVGGFGEPQIRGGARSIQLTATSEVQKVDLLSVDGFAIGANAIVEYVFRIPDDGAGTAADLSLGVANATHGTDADAITEHIFLHLNANDLNIYLQSKDTSTTVTATDTTIDYVEGSAVANRVEVWFDMRNPADVQCYVNGALVLPATVFNLNAVASTLFLLAHLEKTSSADVYRAVIDRACARFMEQ